MEEDDDFPEYDDPTDVFPNKIAGRYVMDRPVGTGRSATVFRAKDLLTEEWVAVKLLHDSLSNKPKDIARFENEGQSMLDIHHPHVVRMIETGVDDSGRHYHVMAFVDGISLRQAINKGYYFSEVEALDIALDLLAGVAQVHRNGRVHRDIKPSNVLLHPNGDALLADFGVVRMAEDDDADDLTDVGDTVGELGFVANEQRGDPHNVGPEADLYSIGALIFAMLAGRPPVDLSLASMRKKEMVDVPGIVAPIILKATAWNAEDRYRTAHEMASKLVHVRDDIARGTGRPARGTEWLNWFRKLTPAPAVREIRTSQRPLILDRKPEPVDRAPIVVALGVGIAIGMSFAAAALYLQ